MSTLPSAVGSHGPPLIRPQRSLSFNSDAMSTSVRSASAAHMVPRASPSPAYVGEIEASDLVSAELDQKVQVSPDALELLNHFLDYVLYRLITTAHSVSLRQLKTVVPLVLKPRLGKQALKVAEEELKDYAEQEDNDDLAGYNSAQPAQTFSVDLAWKLSRLRCMVYARMGSMEEEDEEEWLEREQLLDQANAASTTSRQGLAVSPGAAIFLTSVIEYLGEQALYYAAQHAHRQHGITKARASQIMTPASSPGNLPTLIVLEGRDMNHVGRDSPLSRLWRSWRRDARSTDKLASPSTSTDAGSAVSNTRFRSSSAQADRAFVPAVLEEQDQYDAFADGDVVQHAGEVHSASRNIDEYATQTDRRPQSSMDSPAFYRDVLVEDRPDFQERHAGRGMTRKRSSSVPVTSPRQDSPEENRNADHIGETPRVYHAPSQTFAGTNSTADQMADTVFLMAETTTLDRYAADQTSAYSHPDRSTRSTEPRSLMPTIPGEVGVHRVLQPEEPSHGESVPTEETMASTTQSGLNEPRESLVGASITTPFDFGQIHVPEVVTLPGTEPLGRSPSRRESVSMLSAHAMTTDGVAPAPAQISSTQVTQSESPTLPRISLPASYDSEVPTQERRGHERYMSQFESRSRAWQPALEPDASDYGESRYMTPAAITSDLQIGSESPVSTISSTRRSGRKGPPPSVPVPPLPNNRFGQLIPDRGAYVRDQESLRVRNSAGSGEGIIINQGYDEHGIGASRTGSRSNQYATAGLSETSVFPHPRKGETGRPSPVPSPRIRIRKDSREGTEIIQPGPNTSRRSLDMLIKSDETLHYTLTPDSVYYRPEDVRTPTPQRSQTQDLADFFRNTAPAGQENVRPRTARSAKMSVDASRAPQPVLTRDTPPATAKRQHEVSSPAPVASPRKNMKVGEPRDARVDRSSGLHDLADYARSTGPSDNSQLPAVLASRTEETTDRSVSGKSERSRKSEDVRQEVRQGKQPAVAAASSSATQTAALASKNRKNTDAVAISPTSTPGPPAPRAIKRIKLQARDARPSRHAESTDLVSFIRRGPPAGMGEIQGENNLANRKLPQSPNGSNGHGSVGSSGTWYTNNSQAPLLNHGDNTTPRRPASMALRQPPPVSGGASGPSRTRRGARDPYAIDDSDEETAEMSSAKEADESLIDFLRSTGPTVAASDQSLTALPQRPTAAQEASTVPSRAPSRSQSIDRLRDLIHRGRNEPASSNAIRTGTSQRDGGARAESPHLTQSGSRIDRYRPTQPTYAPHVDKIREKARSEGRMGMLNGSGTPDSDDAAPKPIGTRRPNTTDGGLKKFFSIKSKR